MLFQLGEPRLALEEIRAVEPLSGGSTRRVGCLVVFTDGTGQPVQYHAAVRRRTGDTMVVYVSRLLAEVRIPLAMFSGSLPAVGEEVELQVGLNYRGLLPYRLV